MTKKYFLFVFLVLLVMILINGIGRRSDAYVLGDIVQDDKLNTPALRTRLIADFEQGKAPAEIYDNLKIMLADSPSQIFHPAAHAFGELLFTYVDLEGIGVCDASLAYGCFHSFFAQAIATKGIDVVSQLDAACNRQFEMQDDSGCAHGIGHGLGEYFGPQGIIQQLEICKTLSRKKLLFGCSDGVFMEYHFPTIAESGSFMTERLPIEKGNEYLPCAQIGDLYRHACYMSLPSWWRDLLAQDAYAMAALCEGIEGGLDREYCFLGIGYAMAPTMSHDIPTLKGYCGRLAAPLDLYCVVGASAGLAEDVPGGDSIGALCEGLGERIPACVEKSDMLSI